MIASATGRRLLLTVDDPATGCDKRRGARKGNGVSA